MDDERIEHALKLGPVDEPAYRRGVRARIGSTESSVPPEGLPTTTTNAGPALASLTGIDVHRRGGPVPARTPRLATLAQLAAVLAIAVVVAAVALPGLVAGPARSGDMLDRLHAAGSIRIAVPDAPPQTIAAGGVRIGFDVDVARALATELGLDLRLVPVAPTRQSTLDFDVALGPSSMPVAEAGARSEPYAFYALWLAAPVDAGISDVEQLAGKRVCVVTGSGGQLWTPPVELMIVPVPTEDGCIANVEAGRADAFITNGLLDDELASRGLIAVPYPGEGEPLAQEPRVVVVPGGDGDTATLVVAIDGALATLRESGRLADLSRASFGGRNLTEVRP